MICPLSRQAVVWLLLTLLPWGGTTAGEIFKYEDRAGHVHLTDQPMPAPQYRLLWRSDSRGLNASPASRPRYPNADQARRNRQRFTPMIERVAAMTRLRPELIDAVIRVESSYDPAAVSRAGAVGLMQLMPDTAQRYGVTDRSDPEANLIAGASYLRDLLEMFDSDLRLALAAYNAGENAVKRHGNRVPPFPETQRYVGKVMSAYRSNGGAGT